MPAETAVLQLELEIGSDPIRGTLTDPAGASQPFSGWVELGEMLERAHGLERPTATKRPEG